MAIKCEICESTNVVKQDGVFVCQKCGTKYSVEEAKKLFVEDQPIKNNVGSVDNLTKRLFLFLEDKNWKDADLVCEKILDIDSENATAYLGKLLIDYHISDISEMSKLTDDFSDNINYKRIVRFGNDDLVKQVNQYLEKIKVRKKAKQEQNKVKVENVQKTAIKWTKVVAPILVVVVVLTLVISLVIVPSDKYSRAQALYEAGNYEGALSLFESLGNYKDSYTKAQECQKIVDSKYYITYKKITVKIPRTAQYGISVKDNKIYLSGSSIPSMNTFLSYLVAPSGCRFCSETEPDSVYATFRIDGFTALDNYGFFQGRSNEFGMFVGPGAGGNWLYSVAFRDGETTFNGQYSNTSTKTITKFSITVVVSR